MLHRIRIIRGQLAAIEKMIDENKSSEEILLQLAAIRSAVHQVSILEAKQNVLTKSSRSNSTG
ncbi:metal-sensitive transcriptional regulator [Desulfosporosinus sp.]|uniref:metal-sensitive transcriptional regulator n=1 Tax=Desulfosporosinus sp. TaxID=157907 RepID=UPI00260414EC|nr:metal-sensitive transcriptional regulator [Desulfosporosinus sp.]